MKQLLKIELVLENCFSITIPVEAVFCFQLSDITKTKIYSYYCDDNKVYDYDICKTYRIHIKKENSIEPIYGESWETFLQKSKDVTYIKLCYADYTVESFQVDWSTSDPTLSYHDKQGVLILNKEIIVYCNDKTYENIFPDCQ